MFSPSLSIQKDGYPVVMRSRSAPHELVRIHIDIPVAVTKANLMNTNTNTSTYTGAVRAKDTINQLKEEISNLSKLVEKGAGLSVGQENMVKELIRVRDELTRKTDEQGQTIAVSCEHNAITFSAK